MATARGKQRPKSRKSASRDADAVEAQLARYRAMRHFDRTTEPRGGSNRATKNRAEKNRPLPFVIQKHAATRLHYDFRLGWRGVLKSWAVAKGPSYDPRDKRLAVQVEDHPIEYGGFEGVIPKGQYGGGTVLLWDEGTWSPHGDVDKGLAQGELKFTLHGHKLHGDWVLVRMGGKAARAGKPNWLLIKERDKFARGAGDPCVTVAEPDSVLTGRDLDAIAKNQDHVWDARQVEREAPVEESTVRQRPHRKTGRGASAPRTRQIEKSTATRSRGAASARGKNPAPGAVFPIALTHPDRIVDSESKLTKRELAEYFWAVREHILPHISGRPLSIVRCPRGSTHPCFYQKHVTGTLPQGVEGVAVRERQSGAIETYLTVSTSLGLAGLAQMGVVELHPWGARNRDIEKPDMLVFDLDPDASISWTTLAECAREVRVRLRQCKLKSFVKTTGGKGLHVVAPIQPEHDWSVVKNFARSFARRMEEENRQLYVINMTRTARQGKIYIDYLRNERGATSIAPYSPRARQGAPVAAPLDWKELDGRKAPRFPVADFARWSGRLRRDPWKTIGSIRQSLRADVLAQFASRPNPA